MKQLGKHNQLFRGLEDLGFKQVESKIILQLKPEKRGEKRQNRTTRLLIRPYRRFFRILGEDMRC